MAEETIVAVYDTAAHAQAAVSALRAANVPESAISVQAGGATTATTTSTAAATVPEYRTLIPALLPALIPETIRSGGRGISSQMASLTLSAGLPSTM